mmetsp:Transcript_32373/g.103229  ORF Transcript_32373/g.103229 Transcript_32373/m.103229 type:complete len:139 (+) Transcript_32373:209-625(+)
MLNDPEATLTVFAPLNSAFAALPDGVLATLLMPENQETLTNLLGKHVLSTVVPASAALNARRRGGDDPCRPEYRRERQRAVRPRHGAACHRRPGRGRQSGRRRHPSVQRRDSHRGQGARICGEHVLGGALMIEPESQE